jgi:hypothetical protein
MRVEKAADFTIKQIVYNFLMRLNLKRLKSKLKTLTLEVEENKSLFISIIVNYSH